MRITRIAGPRVRRALLAAAAAVAIAGCGALGQLAQIIQPPLFEEADRDPEIRLLGPSGAHPAGGAAVTVWLEVTNPNAFGFTLSTLSTTLLLEGSRAATGDFPLGLPLQARQTSIVPIELTVSFSDVPGLTGAVRAAVIGRPVEYELDGTVGVDAGHFGRPTFGPMRLVSGELRVATGAR